MDKNQVGWGRTVANKIPVQPTITFESKKRPVRHVFKVLSFLLLFGLVGIWLLSAPILIAIGILLFFVLTYLSRVLPIPIISYIDALLLNIPIVNLLRPTLTITIFSVGFIELIFQIRILELIVHFIKALI